ncbi:MAG TPA: type II toxin-antitoxin system HicB family antitoxin [Methylomirabilota bacterium]|jgi:predicted RNase H-like HicB family nuclease|nr:type II toxin-antitoxin system HicB family antitoxin [Methylomirabilota bacterium]
MAKNRFTAVLEKSGDVYVALCPEVDVASQGGTLEEAIANLKQAVALFLESAEPEEIKERKINIGALRSLVGPARPPHAHFEL